VTKTKQWLVDVEILLQNYFVSPNPRVLAHYYES